MGALLMRTGFRDFVCLKHVMEAVGFEVTKEKQIETCIS